MVKKIFLCSLISLQLSSICSQELIKKSVLDAIIPVKPLQAIIIGYLGNVHEHQFKVDWANKWGDWGPILYLTYDNSLLIHPNGGLDTSNKPFNWGSYQVDIARANAPTCSVVSFKDSSLRIEHDDFNGTPKCVSLSMPANYVTIYPDAHRIAAILGRQTLGVYDIASGSWNNKKIDRSSLHGIAYSPDKKYLAYGNKNKVEIIDSITHKWNREINAADKDHEVTNVAFSPDNNYLATASDDKVIRIWSAWNLSKQIQLIQTVECQTGNAISLIFSPDGQYLIAGTSNGWIFKWALQTVLEWDEKNTATQKKSDQNQKSGMGCIVA